MTPRRLLIVSEPSDLHADAVAWALRQKGHDVERLLTPDFPTRLGLSMRLDPGDAAGRLVARGPGVVREDWSEPFDTVWLRRPGGAVLPVDMHPGDRQVATRQCEMFLASVAPFLDPGEPTFWVNPVASDVVAQQKPSQLRSLAKSFEVRVACLGDFLVALRIDSQADARAATDWRAGQSHVEMAPYTLPDEVAAGCRRLVRDLGLVHASLDFVVGPGGEHVFQGRPPGGPGAAPRSASRARAKEEET